MREPGSITGRRRLVCESFADHRLPFMEFDCGDEKRHISMMQRGKNWWREGLKKKNIYLCFKTLFYFLAVCIAFG